MCYPLRFQAHDSSAYVAASNMLEVRRHSEYPPGSSTSDRHINLGSAAMNTFSNLIVEELNKQRSSRHGAITAVARPSMAGAPVELRFTDTKGAHIHEYARRTQGLFWIHSGICSMKPICAGAPSERIDSHVSWHNRYLMQATWGISAPFKDCRGV